jgi:CRP-like cAMP-binding protein
MSDDKRAILRRVPVFSGLTDDECDAVLRVVKARRGAADDVLFTEGERGDSLVIVLDGELVCTALGREIARLKPGEIAGEMAIFDGEPRAATIRTAAGATVLELSRAALVALKTQAPRACANDHRHLIADVARRLRDAGEKLGEAGAGPMSAPAQPAAGHPITAAQLRAFPVLADRSVEDLELLAYIATLRTFARGGALIVKDAIGVSCFFIARGSVVVTRADRTEPLATLGPGALVGQLALIDRAPRSATVSALEDTIALEIRADAFANLVRSDTPIALRFQEQVALAGVRQLRAATKRLARAQMRPSTLPPDSMRTLDVDDCDDPASDVPLELAVDPRSIRR